MYVGGGGKGNSSDLASACISRKNAQTKSRQCRGKEEESDTACCIGTPEHCGLIRRDLVVCPPFWLLPRIETGDSFLWACGAPLLRPHPQPGDPKILFAGNSLSPDALMHLLEELGDLDFDINVVSKSGTTLEPALAFRMFRGLLEAKYGTEKAKKHIFATTDAHRGVLKQMADAIEEGRAVTVPEALTAVENRLKSLNADVQVEQEEYDEVVVIKALFLNHDYQ